MIRADALTPIRMQATKVGTDTVLLDGVPTEAVKVRLAPDGLLAAFWHGHYWYRKTDGLFLKFEGRRGLPGSPMTVVHLLSPTNWQPNAS